jgi:hypothetical protein
MCIEPAHGKLVVFRSAISHEVTPVALSPDTFGDARFSITGFISDRPTTTDLLRSHLRRLRTRLRRRKKLRRAGRIRAPGEGGAERRQPAAITL